MEVAGTSEIGEQETVQVFFACDDCGEVFDAKSDLDNHMFFHKGEETCIEISEQLHQQSVVVTCSGPCSPTREISVTTVKEEAPAQEINITEAFVSYDDPAGHEVSIPQQCISEQWSKFSSTQDATLSEQLNRFTSLYPSSKRHYSCGTCGKKFGHRVNLSKHLLTHSDCKAFECLYCGKKFSQKVNLSKHILIHTQDKQYQCMECGRRFIQKVHLTRHTLTHTQIKPFACHLCSKLFSQKANLEKHLLIHAQIRDHQCYLCLRRFTQKTNLTKHLLTHQDLEKCFVCNFCGKSYTQQSYLKQHLKTHSEMQIKHDCPQCGRVYRQKSTLLDHIKRHEENLQCQICLKTFAHRGSLKHHMRAHNRQIYKCTLCYKKYRNEESWRAHVKSHGDPKYACDQCGRMFVERSCLLRHARTHRPDPKEFECQECHKMFRQPGQLVRHMAVHNPVQKFECLICQEVFSDASVLKTHSRMHQQNKLFCGECGRGFHQRRSLIKHMLIHEGKKAHFTCVHCKKTFTKKRNLVKHIRVRHPGVASNTEQGTYSREMMEENEMRIETDAENNNQVGEDDNKNEHEDNGMVEKNNTKNNEEVVENDIEINSEVEEKETETYEKLIDNNTEKNEEVQNNSERLKKFVRSEDVDNTEEHCIAKVMKRTKSGDSNAPVRIVIVNVKKPWLDKVNKYKKHIKYEKVKSLDYRYTMIKPKKHTVTEDVDKAAGETTSIMSLGIDRTKSMPVTPEKLEKSKSKSITPSIGDEPNSITLPNIEETKSIIPRKQEEMETKSATSLKTDKTKSIMPHKTDGTKSITSRKQEVRETKSVTSPKTDRTKSIMPPKTDRTKSVTPFKIERTIYITPEKLKETETVTPVKPAQTEATDTSQKYLKPHKPTNITPILEIKPKVNLQRLKESSTEGTGTPKSGEIEAPQNSTNSTSELEVVEPKKNLDTSEKKITKSIAKSKETCFESQLPKEDASTTNLTSPESPRRSSNKSIGIKSMEASLESQPPKEDPSTNRSIRHKRPTKRSSESTTKSEEACLDSELPKEDTITNSATSPKRPKKRSSESTAKSDEACLKSEPPKEKTSTNDVIIPTPRRMNTRYQGVRVKRRYRFDEPEPPKKVHVPVAKPQNAKSESNKIQKTITISALKSVDNVNCKVKSSVIHKRVVSTDDIEKVERIVKYNKMSRSTKNKQVASVVQRKQVESVVEKKPVARVSKSKRVQKVEGKELIKNLDPKSPTNTDSDNSSNFEDDHIKTEILSPEEVENCEQTFLSGELELEQVVKLEMTDVDK